MNKSNFEAYAKQIGHEVTQLREDFHKHAESAWTEFRTASILADKLAALGFAVKAGKEVFAGPRECVPSDEILDAKYNRALSESGSEKWMSLMKGGYTGVVAEIGQGEPVVAMRFDIDALPFAECQDKGYRPHDLNYASVHQGACHTCGHDGHAAMSYGVAKILKKFESDIVGTIRLVVQPAEEGVLGAAPMVAAGVMDGVSSVFAAHVSIDMQPGLIGGFGKKWAAGHKFDIRLTGQAAHSGGNPQGGRNAILAAATIIQNLYALPRHSKGFTRVNVGTINAGTNRNSIAPFAHMSAETRAETDKIDNSLYAKAERVIRSGAEMHDCECEIIPMGQAVSAISDIDLIDYVKRTAPLLSDIGIDEQPLPGTGGCEDYTRMMQAVQNQGGQAVHFYVGADFKGEQEWTEQHRQMKAVAHSSIFDINEKGLVLGGMALAWLLINTSR
ncbi:MAG: amidohydrolase [Clostridia bacterium]|jgi:aminobenzoyl-glutamate utilization protein A|nr:amidohydrolase [Clostridia bacterium]MBT7122923.1 amidohydrolase [Clostridia bacterium]